MTNEEVRRVLEQRTRLEDRIRKLGGIVPNPWPWDDRGELRNLQLLEVVEDLEAGRKPKPNIKPLF